MDMLQSTDVHSLAEKETNARMRIRLLALAHFKDGRSQTGIAEFMGVSRGSANKWVSRILADGLDGLKEQPRSGRPASLRPGSSKRRQTAAVDYACLPSLAPFARLPVPRRP
jgi:hypothetical protein